MNKRLSDYNIILVNLDVSVPVLSLDELFTISVLSYVGSTTSSNTGSVISFNTIFFPNGLPQ